MDKRRKQAKLQARLRKKWKRSTIRHVVISVLTVIAFVVAAVVVLLNTVFFGPSPDASDQLALSCLESSAAKFVPKLFLGEEGLEQVKARNSIQQIDEDVNTDLIVIPQEDEEDTETPDVVVEEVNGIGYRGFMMIVKDPSRVIVGTCADAFGSGVNGKKLQEIIDRYGGIGGLNAGGFWDAKGQGDGGTPIGLVISRGKLMNGAVTTAEYNTAIGFNEDNVLIVHKASSNAEAANLGLRDAVGFGPALIVNGEAAAITGKGSGTNPRSAIGQRADGAVLLLVIDGRQPSSVGASYSDLIDIMLEYGAVNAANLDGGSSATMNYEGRQLNVGVLITGDRNIPTAFVVLPEKEDAE